MLKKLAVVTLLIGSGLAQTAQLDSEAIKLQYYKTHSIYLQESIFISNYKLVQNGVTYRAGKHFKNLPAYLGQNPEIQFLASKSIERRKMADNINFIGSILSFGVMVGGLNDESELIFDMGLMAYLGATFFLQWETVHHKNELLKLVHKYNESLLE